MLVRKVSLETFMWTRKGWWEIKQSGGLHWILFSDNLDFSNLVLILWDLGKISFSVSPRLFSKRKMTDSLWGVFTSLNAGAFYKYIVAVILQWNLLSPGGMILGKVQACCQGARSVIRRMFLFKIISISSIKHLTAMVSSDFKSLFKPLGAQSCQRSFQGSSELRSTEEGRNEIRNRSLMK